jgi:hypothetical protein|tara:strand:- start:491 stop:742 length:252 start_codon:yes stop_codon:yes gene_type:complete
MTKDFLEETKKEQDLLDIGLKMSRQHKAGRVNEEQIKILEEEVKEKQALMEFESNPSTLAIYEEELYNTNQSIESLKNARPQK